MFAYYFAYFIAIGILSIIAIANFGFQFRRHIYDRDFSLPGICLALALFLLFVFQLDLRDVMKIHKEGYVCRTHKQ